jgi:hypothetical protein
MHGIELVKQYPSCFRGKVEAFEDLVVSVLETALRRTDAPANENSRRAAAAKLLSVIPNH